ncbi:uncharacterized protein LOC126837371 isoform X1 [Adelges cooleyi]|uniref:uncharacterized protein LOC126837371 isoform X1 n=2 Tax=Adelges cooleyi TaxID=133065 RepID=UPI00217F7002|nr:uncharacterized protein LOC126837371 isoform X1 [Adelges cooleyi]
MKIMGGRASKLFKSFSNHSASGQSLPTDDEFGDLTFNENLQQQQQQYQYYEQQKQRQQHQQEFTNNSVSPFVHYRRGSMYIDEDGDMAHEFYVEAKVGTKVTLKKISKNCLKPQGDVRLDTPCIRNDYPVVLLEEQSTKAVKG